jgi:TolA-binding protein
MSDPHRLSSRESDADELERALVKSLRGPGPDAHQKAAMFAALAAQVGAAGGVIATSSAAAQATASVGVQTGATVVAGSVASKALVLKVVIVVAALGGAAVGARVLWPEPTVEVNAARAVPAPVLAAPRVEPLPAVEEPAKVRHPAVRTRAPKPRPERLALESRMLTDARAALRSGNSGVARQKLERLREEFPGGVLAQEREVLIIELLAAEKKHGEAAEHLRAFVAAHPESPHAPRLQKLVAAP